MKSVAFIPSLRARARSATSVRYLLAKSMIAVAALSYALLPAVASAIDYSYTYTKFSSLETVFDDGASQWTGTYPIKVIGTVINNPGDMSNYGVYSPSVWWQTYIQALPAGTYNGQTVADGDFGGAAVYMNNYGIYTSTQWADEMSRINYPKYNGSTVTESLRYGDVIMVEARAPGMPFNGKYNVNEQHINSEAKDFIITILQRDTTPTATPVALADLKDSSDAFIFDENRANGCEHYQGSLVHLDNLTLVDPQNWGLNKTVTVQQGDLTFPMLLGLDPSLSAIDPYALQTTPFNLTAILDQEDKTADYIDGYRLWLTNASGLSAVPEPCGWSLLASGILTAMWLRRRVG